MKTEILNIYKQKLQEKQENSCNRFMKEAEAYKKDFWYRRKPKVEKTVDDIENDLCNVLSE